MNKQIKFSDRELEALDRQDSFFETPLYGEMGVITEQEQCYGKQVENRIEDDLDDWLDSTLD